MLNGMNIVGTTMTRYKKPQGVIKLNLIIEIVEFSGLDVIPVFIRIVYLSDENNITY